MKRKKQHYDNFSINDNNIEGYDKLCSACYIGKKDKDYKKLVLITFISFSIFASFLSPALTMLINHTYVSSGALFGLSVMIPTIFDNLSYKILISKRKKHVKEKYPYVNIDIPSTEVAKAISNYNENNLSLYMVNKNIERLNNELVYQEQLKSKKMKKKKKNQFFEEIVNDGITATKKKIQLLEYKKNLLLNNDEKVKTYSNKKSI